MEFFKKFLKIIAKIFLWILGFIFLLVLIIFVLRFYNDYKYGKTADWSQIPKYLIEPKNLSLYDTNISGMKISHIEGKYLNGFEMIPENQQKESVVVVFGGSEGSPAYDRALQIASKWFRVLSLFFFGMPNQNPTLAEIPVEYFSEIEDYIFENFWQNTKIAVVWTSKGAEYALLLSTYYPSIKNLILFAPSAYIYSGLDFSKNTSSWSKDGKPLDFVDVIKSDISLYYKNILVPSLTKAPISYAPSYESALKFNENIEAKRIKVENTDANIVIFAGSDDMVWDSAWMSKIIEEKRPKNTKIFLYDGAWHIFGWNGVLDMGIMRMNAGWTLEKNMEAGQKNVIDFEMILEELD